MSKGHCCLHTCSATIVNTFLPIMCPSPTASPSLPPTALPHSHPPACDDDGLLWVPDGVVSHHSGMQRHVLRRELRQLIGLRVHPPQWLHLLQVVMGRELGREVHRLRGRGGRGGRAQQQQLTKSSKIPSSTVQVLSALGSF